MNFQTFLVNGVFGYHNISQFNQSTPGPFVAKRHLKLVMPFSGQAPSPTFSEGRGGVSCRRLASQYLVKKN